MELASSAASVYPCGRKPEQYPAVPKRQVFRPWGSRCIPVSRSRPEPKENAKPGSTTSIVADIPDLTQSKRQNPNSTTLKDNQVQQMTKKKVSDCSDMASPKFPKEPRTQGQGHVRTVWASRPSPVRSTVSPLAPAQIETTTTEYGCNTQMLPTFPVRAPACRARYLQLDTTPHCSTMLARAPLQSIGRRRVLFHRSTAKLARVTHDCNSPQFERAPISERNCQ